MIVTRVTDWEELSDRELLIWEIHDENAKSIGMPVYHFLVKCGSSIYQFHPISHEKFASLSSTKLDEFVSHVSDIPIYRFPRSGEYILYGDEWVALNPLNIVQEKAEVLRADSELRYNMICMRCDSVAMHILFKDCAVLRDGNNVHSMHPEIMKRSIYTPHIHTKSKLLQTFFGTEGVQKIFKSLILSNDAYCDAYEENEDAANHHLSVIAQHCSNNDIRTVNITYVDSIDIAGLREKYGHPDYLRELALAKEAEAEKEREIEESTPKHYICPIIHEMMHDPVLCKQGHTFERTSIETWIEKHRTCPIDRSPIKRDDLVPNRVLREQIEEFAGVMSITLRPAQTVYYVAPASPSTTSSRTSTQQEYTVYGNVYTHPEGYVGYITGNTYYRGTGNSYYTGGNVYMQSYSEGYFDGNSYPGNGYINRVVANVTGNVFNSSVIGNVTGHLYGSVMGNVSGNVTGNVLPSGMRGNIPASSTMTRPVVDSHTGLVYV